MFGDTKTTYNLKLEDVFVQEDIKNRHLFLNDIIDETIVDSVVYHILRYNAQDRDIAVEDRKPIIIYINSPGGSVSDGYGLVDTIQNSITPVYTVNIGLAASMGFLIFIAGHKRFSYKKSEFLMHEGSIFGGIDHVTKMKDRIEFETGQLEQMTKDYVLENTNITNEKYEEKQMREWYMLPNEAKELGVVDYIVGVDCTINEII